MRLVAIAQADVVAWACFIVGALVLFGGAAIGLWTSVRKAPATAEAAKTKLDEAAARLGEAKGRLEQASSAVASAGLESLTGAAGYVTEAAQAAEESTAEAKSALEQVQGIVASLPENLRFAGLLVLVGTVLMSVAAIQFGGVSLF